MKYIVLVFVIVSQSAKADWMQGFFRFTCIPEIGYFEVSPEWVSAPDQIWKNDFGSEIVPQYITIFEKNGLKPLGTSFEYHCQISSNKIIEVKSSKNSTTFDLQINKQKIIEQISILEDYFIAPELYGGENKSARFLKFINFHVNDDVWTFNAEINTEKTKEDGVGYIVNLRSYEYKKELGPVNEAYLVNKYLKKHNP